MEYFNAFIGGAQIITGFGALQASREESALAIKASELEQMKLRHQSDLLRMQAKDTLALADTDVFNRQQDVKKMLGSQKVALAAQGIIVDGELGQDLARDEKKILREDTAAIKSNAWRQAFGLEVKADDFLSKAAFSAIEATGRASRIKTAGFNAASDSFFSGAQSIMKDHFPSGKTIPKSKSSKLNIGQIDRAQRIQTIA